MIIVVLSCQAVILGCENTAARIEVCHPVLLVEASLLQLLVPRFLLLHCISVILRCVAGVLSHQIDLVLILSTKQRRAHALEPGPRRPESRRIGIVFIIEKFYVQVLTQVLHF